MEIANLSEDHIKDTKNRLLKFAQAVSFQVNNNNLSRYINELKQKYAPKTFRKYVIDIRRLLKHIGHPAAEQIKLPKVPKRRGIVIKREDIQYLVKQTDSLKFKSERLRLKAAILVASTSGLRSEELYKLTMEDINIEERIIYLKAEITKDFEDRVTFFNEEAQKALIEYLGNVEIKNRLFAKSTVVKDFRKLNTSLRMKHMRKFFSQE